MIFQQLHRRCVVFPNRRLAGRWRSQRDNSTSRSTPHERCTLKRLGNKGAESNRYRKSAKTHLLHQISIGESTRRLLQFQGKLFRRSLSPEYRHIFVQSALQNDPKSALIYEFNNQLAGRRTSPKSWVCRQVRSVSEERELQK